MFCHSFLCYWFMLAAIHHQRVQQSLPLIAGADSSDVHRMCPKREVCLCSLISELSLWMGVQRSPQENMALNRNLHMWR